MAIQHYRPRLHSRAVIVARPHQRRFVWLALLAMLALALLPTISHALSAARGGSNWAEVCTPQGLRLVALDGQALPDPVPAVHLEHCPLCALQSAAAAPPPAATVVLPPVPHRAEVPVLFLQAPHTLFAWCSPHPRGPPVFS
jgi:Protein of unknown function (DUF2946)